mmetsp:Transcript_12295/g.34975  ORF Transcript_12295/g.34975 Transcript_12295/m.34975 type:complete len:223 (-) Transcript_12295:39-707(-)
MQVPQRLRHLQRPLQRHSQRVQLPIHRDHLILHQLPQRPPSAHLLDNEQFDHPPGRILNAPDPNQMHDVLVTYVLHRLELFEKQKHLRHVQQVLVAQHLHRHLAPVHEVRRLKHPGKRTLAELVLHAQIHVVYVEIRIDGVPERPMRGRLCRLLRPIRGERPRQRRRELDRPDPCPVLSDGLRAYALHGGRGLAWPGRVVRPRALLPGACTELHVHRAVACV